MKKRTFIVVLLVLLCALPLFAFGEKEDAKATTKKTEPISSKKEETPVASTPVAATPVAQTPISLETGISTPLYKVQLTQAEYITQEDVDATVEYLESLTGETISADDAAQYLINQMVFDQELVRALDAGEIPLYDGQFNEYVSYRLLVLAQQYGFALESEEDASAFLSNFGMTYQDFAQAVLRDFAEQFYVTMHSEGRLEAISEATAEEIQMVYDDNKDAFVSEAYVKLAHVYFAYGSDKNTAKVKADTALNNIKKGLKWNDAVKTYSEDNSTVTTGGEFGVWLDPEDVETSFGAIAKAEVFNKKVGEVTDVIEGVVGYHIIKVIDKLDAHLLGLNELYYPNDESVTVADFIADRIYLSKQEAVYSEILEDCLLKVKQNAIIESLN